MASPRESTKPQDAHNESASISQEVRSTDQVRDKVQEAGAQVREKAQELRSQVQEVAAEYYAQGRERALEVEQTLEARIREKPLQSLLIAGGVGLLIGLLCRRG